ncbi:uncharacterized protein LOC141608547 [Silene latifolia]|uniref:uncharacterized protein LOC141608547 n=1 Tax=Silene latifolia TaxID=37657 RepID=UPI003D7768A0
MTDGCLIAQEIMHYLNKTKKGNACYAALKLDMHKDFDRVSWHFLMAIMQKFGFPTHWQNLIWECISTVNYSVLINGEPSLSFRPSCGLRQGDPLSPYLFIMCMEVLSCQLRQAEQMRMIQGLKISRYAPPISHLFYADDAFICCKATPNSFEALRDLFKCFELAFGQMLNLDKSFIKFSPNAPSDFKSHMTSILKMKVTDCFGNYLGVPVDLPTKKTTAFHPLLDKMTTQIISWSALHLSQPCKLLIINAILIGSIQHLMTATPIPLGICRKIDSLITAFWWRKDMANKSIHCLTRDSLQLPREKGGLGIKSVSLLSQASLMKNYWRIHHHPSGLLSKFLVPKYKKDLPVPGSKSKVSQPSFLWSGICRTVDTFSPALSWKLGNGSSVNLLTSRWVNGNVPSVRPFSHPCTPTLSDLLSECGAWNSTAVFRLFESTCAKAIIAMEPPLLEIDDFLYWKFTEDGIYTVKSGYTFLLSQASISCSPSFYANFPWKEIWKHHASPKFPLLVWRIVHNILPCLENLSFRGFKVSTSCVFCHSCPESLDHLFRSCTVARHVWNSSVLGINSVANPSVPFQRWLADHVLYLHRHTANADNCLLHFFCILKAIWTVRNSVVFENSTVNPTRILQIADYMFASHIKLPSFRKSLTIPISSAHKISQVSNFPFADVSYNIEVKEIFPRDRFSIVITYSLTGITVSDCIRASSAFAASTKGLLLAMYRSHSASSPFVSFQITSRKLSSVLASTAPVPITLRHSLRAIQSFLRMYHYWSVSLATG